MATYESRRYNTPITDVTKIADGSVNNTEFETLDGVTSDIQTQLNAKLNLSGGALTGALSTNNNISLGDDDHIYVGAGQDIDIFSNGSAGFVKANSLTLGSSTNENYLTGSVNGGIFGYFDNAVKFQTTATGLTVSGAMAATTVTGDGSALTALNASNLSSGTVPTARLPTSGYGGKLLQIVSFNNTTFFSSSATTFTDITNMNVVITPTSSSSKVLVSFVIGGVDDASGSNGSYVFRMLRGNTTINEGSGGTTNGCGFLGQETNNSDGIAFEFLDSPNTNTQTTYKLQVKGVYQPNIRINRSQDGSMSGTSNITATEISG